MSVCAASFRIAAMNFPPFWAKASHAGFSCWRWSHQSLSEAQNLAEEAARKLAAQFSSGARQRHRYAYADRPLREPVLREFPDASGAAAAVITRNSYGCLVLNTARVMFVDVDLPEPKRAGGGLLKKLFGKPAAAPTDPVAESLAKAEAWTQRHPGWGWRVYRTRAGLRLLATHDRFEADAPMTHAAFEALAADPLYRQLCKTQKCFRARLTPKPWRCGVANPPARWPWRDAAAEAEFKTWEEEYLAACADFATCELLATLGDAQVHPDVQLVLSAHDQATRAEAKIELA